MRAMQFSHPGNDQLDLSFLVDGVGAVKLPGSGKASRAGVELLKVSVPECECVSPLASILSPQLQIAHLRSDGQAHALQSTCDHSWKYACMHVDDDMYMRMHAQHTSDRLQVRQH
jgi:hypothetical protein